MRPPKRVVPGRDVKVRRVPLVNHLRVPAFLSALLLLIYAPLITRVGARTYRFYSGHSVTHEFLNWLLISVGLFLASGLVYSLRVWRHGPGTG